VLDYGCGPADFGLWMAAEGAAITLLDLSPLAIQLGLKRAAASGVTLRGVAAEASRLPMFQDAEFDLVFACAGLHHTMKYPGALEELARILRPGGRLILCETWGGNPVLNLVRRTRALLAGEKEEQGEGIILNLRELRRLEPWFDSIEVQHLNLLAMAKRLLRGRSQRRWARGVVKALETLDRPLVPLLHNWCGEAVVTASGRAIGPRQ
jgi:SAM-dependent methyltransferase